MTYVSKVKTAVNDDQVVVFNLLISCMSAERQFDLTKLGFDVTKLPSQSRKLVQEKIFPKDFLLNYNRLRERANAVLDRGAAVRLDMGVVSSRSEAVAKIEDLDAIKADWLVQIEKDSHRYASICNDRISLIASQAFGEGVAAEVVNSLVDALKKRQPTWEAFSSRMSFAYSPVPIKLELDESKAEFDPVLFKAQREGLVALREGVFGGLVQFLTRESNELLKLLNAKKPHHGVYTINYRTVARIGGITEKLHGLSFVHQQVAPLAQVIDEALAFMPKSSEKDLPLLPAQFLNLTTVLEAIADQHELLGRLRDKQPLVVVSSNMPPVMVANSPAQAAPVAVAPAAVQVVATATVAAQQASAPTPVVVEVPAVPAVQESYMGLGFLSNSLFG